MLVHRMLLLYFSTIIWFKSMRNREKNVFERIRYKILEDHNQLREYIHPS